MAGEHSPDPEWAQDSPRRATVGLSRVACGRRLDRTEHLVDRASLPNLSSAEALLACLRVDPPPAPLLYAADLLTCLLRQIR